MSFKLGWSGYSDEKGWHDGPVTMTRAQYLAMVDEIQTWKRRAEDAGRLLFQVIDFLHKLWLHGGASYYGRVTPDFKKLPAWVRTVVCFDREAGRD